MGNVLLLAIALFLLFFVSEVAPASLDEIKEVAASVDDVEVTRLSSPSGDPRITFVICGHSGRGVYHCTYTLLIFKAHNGGGHIISEEIVANVGLVRSGALRGEFLNETLMEWGRSKDGKRRPVPEDQDVRLLLENLLGMARNAIRHHEFVSAIAALS